MQSEPELNCTENLRYQQEYKFDFKSISFCRWKVEISNSNRLAHKKEKYKLPQISLVNPGHKHKIFQIW